MTNQATIQIPPPMPSVPPPPPPPLINPWQALYNEALSGLANGKSERDMVAALILKGVPETNARMMVADAMKQKRAAFRKAGAEAAVRGLLLVLLGIAITAGTAALKMPIFVVAWGPVIFGGWHMLKGLYRVVVG